MVSHKALRQTPPEQTPPSPPDQAHHSPRPGTHPLDQACPPGPGTPPPQTRHTTPPRLGTPPPLDQAPPQEADSGIRFTSGRYASYWNAFLFRNHYETRMHSSGMCTACLLAISQHALHRGGVCITVCTGQGGCVSQHALGRGVYPSMHWVGRCLPGGCLPLVPGGCIQACNGADISPVDRQTLRSRALNVENLNQRRTFIV